MVLLLLGLVAKPSTAAPSHGEMRFGIGAGADQASRSFLAPSFRLGLHEFLDRSDGFPLHTQFEILSVGLRWRNQESQLTVDEMKLVKVVSQPPIGAESAERSFRLELGAERIWDRRCDECLAARGIGSLGVTVAPVASLPVWITAFADLELAAGGFSGSKFSPGIGPSMQLRVAFTPSLKAIGDVFYRYFFLVDHHQGYGGSVALRCSLTSFAALQAGWKKDTDHSQLASSIFFYF